MHGVLQSGALFGTRTFTYFNLWSLRLLGGYVAFFSSFKVKPGTLVSFQTSALFGLQTVVN